MSNPRNPFLINVGFIIHEEIGFDREIPFEVEQVDIEELALTDVTGSVHIGRTQQGLVVQGKFSGDTTLECARCLNNFSHHLDWSFADLYTFDEESVTESELILPENAHIDLTPLLREYALLELPINPLHDPDCKGLCIECGQDLNVKDCGHSQNNEDSPFAALKKLL